ncbi:MAG: hypothetical protein J6M07_01665, partial [Ruminococcus sp.]|nr:hypothetical protein [Ruminococcus sp.]
MVEYETVITDDFASGKINVTNSAEVISEKTDNPPKPDRNNTANVLYEHQYSMKKNASEFNTSNDTLQWRIVVDAQSATLDGYEIVDDGFIGKIYDDNQRLDQYISFNAFEGGEHGVNISDKVKLIKASENSDKVTIKLKDGENAKISWIEIFYNQSVRANIGEEEWKNYQKGQEVTAHNTATGKMPGLGPTGPTETGTGDRTGQKQVKAAKKYNSQNHIQVLGNADRAPRTLDWSVTLTNDNGFANNDVYTDTLKSDNGGKHYITSDQAAAFSLKYGTTLIPTTAYTITFYDENNNDITELMTDLNGSAKAVKFTIQFNNSINSSYHSLTLDYTTTADVSGVLNGNTAHFNNGYDYGTTHDQTTNGLTFVREDPTAKTIRINVKKTWNDRNNKFNTRPDDYTVEIWRAKADSNGNCPDANDPDAWEKVNTYNLTNDQVQLTDNFPQWFVETDDEGIESLVHYCYKIVETNIK